MAKIEGEIGRIESKLAGFVARAPEAVIAKEREKLEGYAEAKAKLIEQQAVIAALDPATRQGAFLKHPRLRFPCRDVINIIIRLLGNESLYEYVPAATLLRRITAATMPPSPRSSAGLG